MLILLTRKKDTTVENEWNYEKNEEWWKTENTPKTHIGNTYFSSWPRWKTTNQQNSSWNEQM